MFLPLSPFSAPLAAFTDDLPDEDEERSGGGGGEGGVDAGDMEAGEGGGGGNLHKDLQLQGGPLRGSQQNLYPDINVIPPSRSRSPSASKSSEGEAL